VSAKYENALRQPPTADQVLPIAPPEGETQSLATDTTIYSPDRSEILAKLLPLYLRSAVFQAFLETLSGWDTNGCDPDLLAQEDAVLFMSEYLAAFGRARLFGNECADETLRGRPPVQTISVTVRE